MRDRLLATLRELRAYALSQNVEASFYYHEEDSYLMRFANSAVSLNTNERLIRLEITAYVGRQRASYELITDLGQLEAMKRGLDLAAEMARHAQPLSYQPSVPDFVDTFADDSNFDAGLAELSNEDRLAYFNRAVHGLETDEIRASGIFSCGANTLAQISTRSEHTQYFKTSDAQVSLVLAHTGRKWEALAEQSAWRLADLRPAALRRELAFMLERYQHDPWQPLPLGTYDIVFGPAATGDLLSMLNWIGIDGGAMRRGFACLNESQLGQRVFSEQFNLSDDRLRPETFPVRRDAYGLQREIFPLVERGVFKAFTWRQDDADEFGAQPTGHSVPHKSLVLSGGQQEASTLEELVRLPRERDVLYIPFLHYMNLVNPSKGLVTASSRFGALWLKADGSIVVPYNVRLTHSLFDIFGDRLAWMSAAQTVNNTSMSYGARNPTAVIVPTFIYVRDLEISHANAA